MVKILNPLMLTDGHFLYPSLDLRSYSTCFTLYSMYNKMHIEADYVMSKYGLQLNNSYLQLQLGQNYAFNCMIIFVFAPLFDIVP